jgi:hypothetical protein
MTVAELANVANVSQRTVRRVVESKYPGKMEHGKKTTFSRDEATSIMADLRKLGFVVPELSGKMPESVRQNSGIQKLPSGAQLNALRHIYPLPELMDRLDFVLGYPIKTSKVYSMPALDAAPVDHALASAGLKALGVAGKLSPAAWDKARRAAIAAGSKVLTDEAAKLAADGQQGRLL